MRGAALVWTGPVSLEIDADPVETPPELGALVDAIWSRERELRPSLVDGTILSVVDVTQGRVVAQQCPYRLFLARERDEDVRRLSRIRAIGVSGIVIGDDARVVLGRRSQTVTEYPGAWELVPSGGIDSTSSPRDALLRELEEEVGISRDRVVAVRPIGLVHDLGQDGFDICFQLQVEGDAEPSEEYGELVVVSLADARELLRQGPAVPTSRVLVEAV